MAKKKLDYTKHKEKILNELSLRPSFAFELANKLSFDPSTVQNCLIQLEKFRLIVKDKSGRWTKLN